MKDKNILVTGSSGLVGSESVKFYCNHNHEVYGIDNDMRKVFFGAAASTEWNKKILESTYPDNFHHFSIDIRNKNLIEKLFKDTKFDLIIHTASQPSHDWAAKDPFTDFTINADGTLNLLENYRTYCPEGKFIYLSTNKVYGDSPNRLYFIETDTRYDIVNKNTSLLSSNEYQIYNYQNGINEKMSIDNSKHSLFGVSKLAGDLLTQEYGKYFGLDTIIFRCGCITGPAHSSVQLHGFLSYLVNCILTNRKYTIFGYHGKQVRDIIHSYDVVNAIDFFFKLSKKKGEVYNMGGSRYSNISILEAIKNIEDISDSKAIIEYVKEPRIGDHKWWITDVSKFRSDYPNWNFTYNIDRIINELIENRNE